MFFETDCHPQSACLIGVKMLCANLEATSMRGCYFEDPAGTRANMEGTCKTIVCYDLIHI